MPGWHFSRKLLYHLNVIIRPGLFLIDLLTYFRLFFHSFFAEIKKIYPASVLPFDLSPIKYKDHFA
jgi:hypothetical protein